MQPILHWKSAAGVTSHLEMHTWKKINITYFRSVKSNIILNLQPARMLGNTIFFLSQGPSTTQVHSNLGRFMIAWKIRVYLWNHLFSTTHCPIFHRPASPSPVCSSLINYLLKYRLTSLSLHQSCLLYGDCSFLPSLFGFLLFILQNWAQVSIPSFPHPSEWFRHLHIITVAFCIILV